MLKQNKRYFKCCLLEEFVSAWGGICSVFIYGAATFPHKIGKLFVSCYNFFHRYRRILWGERNLMETIICGHCGAPVFYDDGLGYGVCEYCGSIIKDRGRRGRKPDESGQGKSAILWKWSRMCMGIQTAFCSSGLWPAEGRQPQTGNVPSSAPHRWGRKEEILRYEVGSPASWRSFRVHRTAHRIFKVELPEAMGPPGQPGDETKLVNTANRIGSVYTGLIYWGLEFQTDATPNNLKGLALEGRKGMAGINSGGYRTLVTRAGIILQVFSLAMKVPQDTSLVLRNWRWSNFSGVSLRN